MRSCICLPFQGQLLLHLFSNWVFRAYAAVSSLHLSPGKCINHTAFPFTMLWVPLMPCLHFCVLLQSPNMVNLSFYGWLSIIGHIICISLGCVQLLQVQMHMGRITFLASTILPNAEELECWSFHSNSLTSLGAAYFLGSNWLLDPYQARMKFAF